MLIGVPKEIKNHEYRVGLTPGSVRELVHYGHSVLIESNAGLGIGKDDQEYIDAGAEIIADPAEVFDRAEMIVKVKEPQPEECRMLHPEQILFTYLHLSADLELTRLLLQSGVTAIAYETVTGPDNSLPLLAPMSEVAGRLAIQKGAHYLEKIDGGHGILLGGVTGVAPAKVLIIGAGIVGINATYIAIGMGAEVTLLNRSITRLRELDQYFSGRAKCIHSCRETIEQYTLDADLVVGAVLVPGAAAPKLLNRELISRMKKGSVLVDVAIDQGGCFETSRPTTHQDPVYLVDGIVHYCVANIPAVVPHTSTYALNNVTMPFALTIANKGYREALKSDPDLLQGLNVHQGHVTCEAVALSLGFEHIPAEMALTS